MENKSKASGGGLGIGGVLTIVFIVLKLVGVIDWSWVWVLAPMWICAGVVLLLILCAVIVAVGEYIILYVRAKR